MALRATVRHGAIGAALLAALLGLSAATPAPRARDTLVLWAWERAEDLRFLAADSEIAFVAATIRLAGDRVLLRHRSAPLLVPPGARLIPVIHVDAGRQPALDDRQRAAFVDAVLRGLANLTPDMVQIDFEALPSQRAFYAQALAALRARLPQGTRLSITALASWCMYETWTAALPVDEVVPMLFRMGRGSAAQYAIDGGGDFRQANCRTALGVATNEMRQRLPPGRRLYVFNPRPWDGDGYREFLQEARSWR
jgi:hypothetical protein